MTSVASGYGRPGAAEGARAKDADAGDLDAEAALVARAAGDPQAFAALYRRHYDAVAGYLFRRTGDAHVTEDLVSETFLAALRGIGGWRRRGVPFRYWLLRIATNAANRRLRRERGWLARWRRGEEADAAMSEAAAAPERGALEADDAAARVHAALRELGAAHRTVLSLHYVEGLGVEEVARVLGCRPGTVKSRLARARDALRARLGRRR